MKITYDPEGDSMYIKLTKKKVSRTVEVSNRLFVDLDKENNLRGLEILFVSKALKDTDFTKLEFQLPRIGEVILNLPAPAK